MSGRDSQSLDFQIPSAGPLSAAARALTKLKPWKHVDGADPSSRPSFKPLIDGLGVEVCRHIGCREGVLAHGLHPDHCAQTSLDLTKYRCKHATRGADHPLRRAMAELVNIE